MGAISEMLRVSARRLERESSHTLPEAWARSRMLIGRRVCITADDRGTAVSVMEVAAEALDQDERERNALAAALAETQAKLAALREAAENYMDAHDSYAEDPNIDWDAFNAATSALADAIHSSGPEGGY